MNSIFQGLRTRVVAPVWRDFLRKQKKPLISNRSKMGLYEKRDVRTGNRHTFSDKKTRRVFKPNRIHKRVWSDILQDWVGFDMTAAALKTIDKVGGIDNYLLRYRNLQSFHGERVREKLYAKLREQGRTH
mmetsp:Transcript_46426/g.145281  ORF Transcript_46426/g.145281 Transcript_46426/m.145281 type:complete len:130 (-) Transcript_46426:158-547(-)|eukprot:CAMPEP_0118861926 /NCGR_PEP_ID=MMETSP1163-20130328/7296_1 /TAXON_ID=124430 /ORGANISM="Phaeomonas parva, Strain CCMP2877" /LENGTH=129 /DNA_ID=CAMNT_0006795773 /DNA_START=211 /DNA_END=600 /DNA_ORIENTATION=-